MIRRVLILDNYDSFTYNLAQLVAAASGIEPIVIYNDALSEPELRALDFDAVILSPGPGRPERGRDFGLCEAILRDFAKPVLGVCLGHQGIGYFSGGTVRHAPEPMHGRVSAIRHTGTGLFRGVPSPFNAARYHSLLIGDIPECLEVDAVTEDGLVMAVHHRELPLWGVQFHPESIASEHGDRIIGNFLSLAQAHVAAERAEGPPRISPAAGSDRLKPMFRRLRTDLPSQDCFDILHGGADDAFWLDSSSHGRRQGRYSFMGDGQGPRSESLSYDVTAGIVTVKTRAGTRKSAESVFDYVERRLAAIEVIDNIDMPVPFKGGYVGYLGYELKAVCGGRNAHRSRTPDAMMVFADRFLAFDHDLGEAWMVCLVEPGKEAEAGDWFDRTEARLRAGRPAPRLEVPPVSEGVEPWRMRHDQGAYLGRIGHSLREIANGESYEVCLCNEWTRRYEQDPLATYQLVRTLNPAPYSAFLRFGALSVLSCSPERMVRLSKEGLVDCRPIKGTIARGAGEVEDAALREQLRMSEKDRAENLMIVDLIRNDLNRVCRSGTVAVPDLCAIESFATVHQMVSTVVGELRDGETAVSCVRSLFPGGSMTGAPKIRTMEIIDALEGGPRGIYSGAIGYFSLDGAVDLSIVIRTVVVEDGRASVGAGGAITALSDPAGEFDETMLKGAVLRETLARLDPVAARDAFPENLRAAG